MNRPYHAEKHSGARTGWLRPAVLAANDAIVSTASLMLGMAAANNSREVILLAGMAGLVGGAMSMAVGEYLSVSSQRDAQKADIEREKGEIAESPKLELNELAGIYVNRGLDRSLALEVAKQLTRHDAIGAHLRDELNINPKSLARPFQAAWTSAAAFAFFASTPILFLLFSPESTRIPVLVLSSLISLASLGAFGAQLGGAPVGRATLRVTLGGILALAMTAAIGKLIGISLS